MRDGLAASVQVDPAGTAAKQVGEPAPLVEGEDQGSRAARRSGSIAATSAAYSRAVCGSTRTPSWGTITVGLADRRRS